MNKIFSKIAVFAVGAAMAVGVGVAASRHVSEVKAADSIAYSLVPEVTGDKEPYNKYELAKDVTYDDITWNVMGNVTLVPWRIGGKSTTATNADRPIYSKTAIADNITKIVIKVGAASSITVNSLTVGVYSSADDAASGSSPVASFTPAFTANSNITIEKADETDWSNKFYRIVFNVTVTGSSNKYVALNGIDFYKNVEGSIDSVTVKGPEAETGELNITSGLAGLSTVKLTAEVAKTGELDETVTWSSGDASKAMVDQNGNVLLVAEGSATIRATSTVDTTKFGEITLNISGLTGYAGSKAVADFTDKATWGEETISDFTADLGGGVTIKDGGSTSTKLAYNKDGSMRVYTGTIVEITSANPIDYIVFTSKEANPFVNAPATTDGKAFMFGLKWVIDCTAAPKTSVKLSYTGTTAYILNAEVCYVAGPSISVAADKESLAKGETATITTTLNNGATGTPAYVADNPSLVELLPAADGLTCTVIALSAAETTVVTITVSLEGCESKTVKITIQKDAVITGITIKTQPTKLTYYVGDTIDLTGIAVVKVYDDKSEEPVAIEDLDVAADLSAVAEDVDVTLTLKGTTHEAHFKVDVVEKPAPAGITVAQALALLKEVPTPTEAKATNYVVDAETSHEVTGFLTDIGTWNATSKLGSFYLATEAGGATKLQVFCIEDYKAVFDAAVAAKAGAEVTVTGVLGVYAKENSKDHSIERQEEIVTPSALVVVTPAPEEEVLDLTLAEAITRANAFEKPEASKTTDDTKLSKVTAIVTQQGSWYDKFGNGDIYIGASTEALEADQIQIFRFNNKDIFDQCKPGAEIEVKGRLALYNNSGTYKVEYKDAEITVKTPAPEVTPIEKTVAEAVALIKTVTPPANTKTTYVSNTQTYKVEGLVIDSYDSRNQVTIIGLTGDSTDQLKVDGIDATVYGTIKAAGTKISATGLLAWYKNKDGVDAFEVLSPVVEKLADPADPIEVNVAGALEALKDVTPANPAAMLSNTQQYAVTGYVKNVVGWSDSYKNASIYIVDSEDGTGTDEIQVLRVTGYETEEAFKAAFVKGTKIKATGLLGAFLTKEGGTTFEVVNPTVTIISGPVVKLSSLSYEGTPKTTYEIGDSLDLSGITKIIATYSDSTEEAPHTKEVALADCTVSGFDSTNAGNKVVKVAYTEDDVEVSFNIMVKVNAPVPPTPEDPTVVGISVLNEKTEYEVGDTFDLNALTVTLDMSDDSEVAGVLGTNYTIEGPEGFDGTFRAAGTFTFTVVALEDESVTASFTVTVTAPEPPAPTLVSITVTTTVTEYNVGDVIDKSTLTVTATYSDGSTAVIAPEEYTVAFDSSTASEEVPVTVTYQGKTYTFKVKVKALAPAKKGCGGEIVTTSIILSTLSLAGVALLSLKKKKED